jgi:hypothetical protein
MLAGLSLLRNAHTHSDIIDSLVGLEGEDEELLSQADVCEDWMLETLDDHFHQCTSWDGTDRFAEEYEEITSKFTFEFIQIPGV